jgi:hypothetical protein
VSWNYAMSESSCETFIEILHISSLGYGYRAERTSKVNMIMFWEICQL